jgi:membrane-associated phospholipid phosphatase
VTPFFQMLENGIGLRIVLGAQSLRNPVFDIFEVIIYYVANFTILIPLFALIYWTLNKQLGQRILFAIVFASCMIFGTKMLLERPRPENAHPELVTAYRPDDSYGIPSGHTGITLAAWGTIAAALKKRRVWAAVLIYIVTVGFFRMYAGAHYPQDVIIGGIIGFITIAMTYNIVPRLIAWLYQQPMPVRLIVLLVVVMFMFYYLWGDPLDALLPGLTLGAGIGFMQEQKLAFSPAASRRRRALDFVIGVAVVGGLAAIGYWFVHRFEQPLVEAVMFAFIGWLIAYGWPWLAFRGHPKLEEAVKDAQGVS